VTAQQPFPLINVDTTLRGRNIWGSPAGPQYFCSEVRTATTVIHTQICLRQKNPKTREIPLAVVTSDAL